ncbi:hypothetical protein [Nocardioides mangrovi]|uniref:Peptidase MA-like domain-containing protein n=1 Tax=Nocardioides mangrovi TaxID=2874580 RepID=A0ABS7UDJ7_9ACTN|nr:hypothetical protein [Nocardioides mangrovi]MBZ5738717.1 hypothetical protein [Nocardioides mangrovi]
MSTTRRRASSLAAALLGLAALTACSGGSDGSSATPSATSARDIARTIGTALDARADAVRHADNAAFLRQVGGGRVFRDQQQTWYDDLTQLPIAVLRYRVDPASLVRDGDAYWVTVRQALQLDGYDAAPVVTEDRYRFAAAPHDPDRMRLVSVTDAEWEAEHDVRPQPWDTGAIQVRQAAGVLGIFDADSIDAAPALLTSVEEGISAVAARVPYDWSRTVVVYALSDETFLDSLEDLPGDDPGDLDAVAFPVGESTRFVLNPAMLDRPGPDRDRLVRHELTHVAVGGHDDTAPVWLSEGLAEWVSVAPVAPQDRRIPDEALAAAEAGVSDLPDDETFNDEDSEAHYGLAWFAVQYLADTYGEDAPWQLLDAVSAPGADVDTVLDEQFGTSTHELAVQAGRLIVSLYDPSAGG